MKGGIYGNQRVKFMTGVFKFDVQEPIWMKGNIKSPITMAHDLFRHELQNTPALMNTSLGISLS